MSNLRCGVPTLCLFALLLPVETPAQTPAAGTLVDIIVTGTSQPLSRITREERVRHAFRIEQAGANYRNLSTRRASESAIANARSESDQATVEFRRATAQRVRLEIQPQQDRLERLLASLGATAIRRFWVTNGLAAKVPPAALPTLAADPDVLSVRPLETFRTTLNVSVPAMGIPLFWEYGGAGQGQSIAILDTGIRSEHPMFTGTEVVARSFATLQNACVSDDIESPRDYDGHGTHVASIAVGRAVPELGIAGGVAPRVDKIYALKVGVRIDRSVPGCERAGGIAGSAILAALEYLIEQTNGKVVNMSFGWDAGLRENPMSLLVDQLTELYDIQFIIAAGNDGPNARTVGAPAEAFNGISVANTDTKGTIASDDDDIADSSSRGPAISGRRKPDIAAPGQRIVAASAHTLHTTALSGTSMAAPHVAGAVAILRQLGLDDPLQMKAVLLNSTIQNTWSGTGWISDRGYGMINLPLAAAWMSRSFRGELTQEFAQVKPHFWKGRAGDNLYVTAVNYRHVLPESGQPVLNDLSLSAWATDGNRRLAYGQDPQQNVQQFAASAEGEIVIALRPQANSLDPRTPKEQFALALSAEGFEPATGPALSFFCNTPLSAPARQEFTATCTITNSGDLPIFSVQLAQTGTAPLVSIPVLGAGVELSRTLRIAAPPTIGTATYNFRATGTAYGYNHSGSLTKTIQIVPVPVQLPVVGASPTILTFSWQPGQAAPALQALRLSATGTGVTFAAQPQSNWIGVSNSGGAVPSVLNVSINPQNMLPGTYDSSIRVLLNGSSISVLTVPVRLEIMSRATPALTDLRTTANSVAPNCTVPTAQENFSSRNGGVTAWAQLQNILPGDNLVFDWINPSGAVHRSTPVTFRSTGPSCAWDSLPTAALQPASHFGLWTVKTTLNGAALAPRYFIFSGVNLSKAMTTAYVPAGNACPTPAESTVFSRSSRNMSIWFLVEGAAAGDRPVVEWWNPSSVLYRSEPLSPVPSPGNWCYYATLDISGTPVASTPGDWFAVGKWNGAVLFGRGFRLQ